MSKSGLNRESKMKRENKNMWQEPYVATLVSTFIFSLFIGPKQ